MVDERLDRALLRALQQRDRIIASTQISIIDREVVETDGDVGMIGAQGFLPDRQRSLEDRLRTECIGHHDEPQCVVVCLCLDASLVLVVFFRTSASDRDSLRQFLKFVQETTRASQSESSYLQLLK